MLYLSVLSNTLNMEPRIPGKEGTNRKKKKDNRLGAVCNGSQSKVK